MGIDEIKEGSLAHSLIKVARLINERALREAREKFGVEGLTYAHLELFAHIHPEGSSVGEIAKSKQVSKQAVSKLVQQMVSQGVLYFKDCALDKRSKKVCFHLEGAMSIQKGLSCLQEIDKEFSEILSLAGYKKLNKSVKSIMNQLQKRD
jgi:DNA-binding MarR family transcriptional regulator